MPAARKPTASASLDARSDVDAYRARAADLVADLARVEDAPPTAAEIAERIARAVAVEENAARDAFNPARLLGEAPDVESLGSALRASSVGGLAIVLGRKAVIDALAREAQAEAEGLGLAPLDEATKVAERERIEAEIFDAEVGEELAARRVEAGGGAVPRRSYVRNPAVLIATNSSLAAAR